MLFRKQRELTKKEKYQVWLRKLEGKWFKSEYDRKLIDQVSWFLTVLD